MTAIVIDKLYFSLNISILPKIKILRNNYGCSTIIRSAVIRKFTRSI